ncbi:MAG: hypothetical protein DKINENOH_03072 [bacterium]|nr:hypothetical protein [bacterium]
MMKRRWLFGILPWIFLTCQTPTDPVDDRLSSQKTHEVNTIEVQLWAGCIKYAAYVGGLEWRATFEVKVMVDSTKNIRDDCEITFFWKAKSTKPVVTESGWISHPGIFKHGLMSIDGMWLDRLPLSPLPQPYWMRAQVTGNIFDSVDVIGMCNFLESAIRPDTLWIESDDMGYGFGERMLASTKVSRKRQMK